MICFSCYNRQIFSFLGFPWQTYSCLTWYVGAARWPGCPGRARQTGDQFWVILYKSTRSCVGFSNQFNFSGLSFSVAALSAVCGETPQTTAVRIPLIIHAFLKCYTPLCTLEIVRFLSLCFLCTILEACVLSFRLKEGNHV